VFKQWFTSASTLVLWGRNGELCKDEGDLVALAPVETDRLNILLQSYRGWFFRKNRQSNSEPDLHDSINEVFYYPHRQIQRAGAVILFFLEYYTTGRCHFMSTSSGTPKHVSSSWDDISFYIRLRSRYRLTHNRAKGGDIWVNSCVSAMNTMQNYAQETC